MIDRNFKRKCKMYIRNGDFCGIRNKLHNDMRSVKREIYNHGMRDRIYTVEQIDEEGIILNIFQLKYTIQGTIFQKQTYSQWKVEKEKAKYSQFNILWQ